MRKLWKEQGCYPKKTINDLLESNRAIESDELLNKRQIVQVYNFYIYFLHVSSKFYSFESVAVNFWRAFVEFLFLISPSIVAFLYTTRRSRRIVVEIALFVQSYVPSVLRLNAMELGPVERFANNNQNTNCCKKKRKLEEEKNRGGERTGGRKESPSDSVLLASVPLLVSHPTRLHGNASRPVFTDVFHRLSASPRGRRRYLRLDNRKPRYTERPT